MSRYSLKIRKPIIAAILTAEHAHSCAFHIQKVSGSDVKEPPTHDYVTADALSNENTMTAGADKLYAIGSAMKLIINFALYRMMEDGERVLEDDVRETMRGAWNEPAIQLCNKLRRHRGERAWTQPSGIDPSVFKMMTHTSALPEHQRGLLGPDGIVVMSEETFGQTLANLVNSTSQVEEGKFNYSNWNTILLGFIIKYAANQSLADALKRIVLDYCNMSNTVLDRATYQQKKDNIARPYVSTAVSESQESFDLDFLGDDAALAVCGGFSCVEDMTSLLENMWKPALDGDENMKEHMFHSDDRIANEEIGIASFPSGMYTALDSTATGAESFERLPESNVYQLGRSDGRSIPAISKAGAVRGYACHFYMIPYQRLIIAVMTNTSGIADPSQIVAQYLIQETLKLSPPLDHFEIKASSIYTKNREILSKATCHRSDLGFSFEDQQKLQGRYTETVTRQQLVIEKSSDYGLRAYIQEAFGSQPRRTSDMQLIKIAENTVAFSPSSRNIAIDAYHAWRNFGLQIKTLDNGKVDALVRATDPDVVGQSDSKHSTFNECYKKK